jgi:hypothetical protein
MSIPGVTRHARDRMAEYHGRDLTRDEWLAVVLAILEGRTVMVRRAGEHSGEIHDVTVGGLVLRFAWEPLKGQIVTTLRDQRHTCRKAARARDGRLRGSVRIGRGFYDHKGERI